MFRKALGWSTEAAAAEMAAALLPGRRQQQRCLLVSAPSSHPSLRFGALCELLKVDIRPIAAASAWGCLG